MKTLLLTTTLVLAAGPAAAQLPRFGLDTLRVSVGSRAGALASATRSIEVLDRRALDALPVSSVQEVLAWLTGVDVLPRSPAQADVGIRGSSFEQVVVLVDGMPVSDDQTGHFDLDLTVPLESVQRIEILRGSGSALYGPDAVGGIINIVTTRPSPDMRVRVEGGSFGTAQGDGDAALRLGQATVRAAASFSRSDGHRDGTDYDVRLGRAALVLPAGVGELRAHVGLAARDFGAAEFYGPYDSYEETRVIDASLAWRPAESRAFTLEPRLHFRRHRDRFVLLREDPAFYENLHTNARIGAELVARLAVSDAVRLAAGASADRMDLESTRLGELDESRGALFAELAAGDPARAALTAGLRADWHSTWGDFLSPSLAAAVSPARSVRLRASLDRGFRAPTWTERLYEDPANIGNPDLLPERFWNAEAGVAVAAGAHVTFDLAAFLRRADRLIDWVRPADEPTTTPWQITNLERATFRGLELAAAFELAATAWVLRATTLSFDDEEAAGYTSKYALRPLTETVALESAVPLPGGLQLRGRIAHARRAGESPYVLLDARLMYTLRGLSVFFDGTNLTDERYVDVSAQPAAGRAFRIGLRLDTDR